jgi:phosphoribosyl 1,2-cyclic phosphodiesterase
MELTILGSSSNGNCYLFQNNNEALVIECGVSLKEVKRAVDFNISKIAGALVTHEHGDHAGHIGEFVDAQIPVYLSNGTREKLALPNLFNIKKIEKGNYFKVGNFRVVAFETVHDAAEPLLFLIHHKEMGVVLFATDTSYVKYQFNGLNNVLIECNYCPSILEANVKDGIVATSRYDRVVMNHCSLDTCNEFLAATDLTKVKNIVLLHLSDQNSNETECKRIIEQTTNKNVYIAKKNLKINL